MNDIVIPNQSTEIAPSTASRIAEARAEVEGHLMVAMNRPRDMAVVKSNVRIACQNPRFAEIAMYAYERGGQYKDGKWVPNIVTGPSIRLMEEIASQYGRIKQNWKITDASHDEYWMVLARALDMQTLNYKEIEFPVEFKRVKNEWENGKKTGNKITEYITDPRDKYEHCANMAQRRLRSCIEKVIPWDVRDEAILQVHETMRGTFTDPTASVVQKGKSQGEIKVHELLSAIHKEVGFSKIALEKQLNKKMNEVTPDELIQLQAALNAVRDKIIDKNDFLGFFQESVPLDVEPLPVNQPVPSEQPSTGKRTRRSKDGATDTTSQATSTASGSGSTEQPAQSVTDTGSSDPKASAQTGEHIGASTIDAEQTSLDLGGGFR